MMRGQEIVVFILISMLIISVVHMTRAIQPLKPFFNFIFFCRIIFGETVILRDGIFTWPESWLSEAILPFKFSSPITF